MKQVFQLTGLNGTLLAKRPKPEKKEEERGRERERTKQDSLQQVDSNSDKAEAALSCAADLSAHVNT